MNRELESITLMFRDCGAQRGRPVGRPVGGGWPGQLILTRITMAKVMAFIAQSFGKDLIRPVHSSGTA